MALEEKPPRNYFVDKMCAVAGGAAGVGEATVHALVARGARVLILDVNDEDGEALAILHGPKAIFIHWDPKDERGLEEALQQAMKEFDLPLHAYIDCAAIIGALGPIDRMHVESFAATLDTNVTSTFLGIKQAARVMKMDAVIGGAIVAMSSTASVRGGLAPAAFTASQHAVIGLTQQAAAELAPAGIRVNCVSPTIIDTPMWRKYLKGDVATSLVQDLQSYQALPHLATVEDMANSIVFLASDESAAITGSNVVVDGGALSGIGGLADIPQGTGGHKCA
ncbi:NAD(P)-binding protein [Coccomyxa subellipsoidea C-169]|uniref:NAD(P)-binding protein n=1 Tax=Coccomyxa subellipsoidea (strain C-169) TaxID=574566 RepID=I0Z2Q7_COCSC|nr:NAD(P)-binding protein [Coccomyxa subellipsoidea C-169]EIE24926.1 NAD(P)-binding protein [Coccomyxa subellipsoidea C-169]|eukprot:XP_005649470.1 NAD(P)-binding protein [Coccomyxa subellipsoidea C-169]